MASSAPSRKTSSSQANYIRLYLLAYNSICFALWTTCTLRMFLMIPLLAPSGHSPAIFTHLFSPLLVVTQSLAVLEILHSITRIVRAPVFTTFMQVGSRILLVWGVMYLFREGGGYIPPGEGIVGGDYEGVVGKGVQPGPGAKVGDLAFFGCLAAWGVTECVRYGFFTLQVWGTGVPAWWTWLR
jgi:very-long-chain (3R)-3-hydroxyacyl-CoA dehydratase